jgi:pilus assembly protein TadC
MSPIPRNRRRREMALLTRARRRIQKLSPYQSLALLLVPLILVEPLKLIALFVAGEGHWLTGTGMIIGAYAVSLLVVERLFKVVKPKLMMLSWFARLWTW